MKNMEPLIEVQEPGSLVAQLAELRKEKEKSKEKYDVVVDKNLQLEHDLQDERQARQTESITSTKKSLS